jgi:hypothetical protein
LRLPGQTIVPAEPWFGVALQHQLAVLKRSGTRRPRFRAIDRLFCGRYPLYRLIQRYGMDSMRRARSRIESRISGFVSLKYSFDA